MTIMIDLKPEIEDGLSAQADARGISLTDYVNEIVAREAHAPVPDPELSTLTGQALIDGAAGIRGILTDEEIDTLFTRNRSVSRSIEL
jgi:hypothetical protein